jgi:hypothetical protein
METKPLPRSESSFEHLGLGCPMIRERPAPVSLTGKDLAGEKK